MTGMDFVKKIGAVGSIMFGLIFVLYLVICFSSGTHLLKNYSPPETSSYYAEHLNDLKTELETNVLPSLPEGVTVSLSDSVIKMTVPEKNFWDVRNAILNHFDSSLFEFAQE